MFTKIKDILTLPTAHAELTKLNAAVEEKTTLANSLQHQLEDLQKNVETTTSLKLMWEQEKTDLVKTHTDELTKLTTNFEGQIAALNKKAEDTKVDVKAEVNAGTANALVAIGIQDTAIKELHVESNNPVKIREQFRKLEGAEKTQFFRLHEEILGKF